METHSDGSMVILHGVLIADGRLCAQQRTGGAGFARRAKPAAVEASPVGDRTFAREAA
jgi:hypothetical protein